MEKILKGHSETPRILVLDVLWREKPEDDTVAILGGLQLHQKVLEYLNKYALTIGLSSYPPIFKHRVTYCVRQGFSKPLRLEFYKYLMRLMIILMRIVFIHKPHVVYNPGVGWHNDWLALFAKLFGLKVASYFHHYSLPGGKTVYPRSIHDLPKLKEMCKEIKRVSRIPFFKLLDYLISFQQLKLADIVFTGTEFGLHQLLRIGRRKHVILTRIGIDLEEFKEEPSYEKEKIWDGLFVGRMAPEKGIYDLLVIWKRVVDKIPNAKLAVVGKRIQPYFEEWINMAREMGIEKNVFYLGELDRNELIKTYYSSKVFIFPSKIEGAGIVVAEAMAAGLIVVARNLPTYKTLYRGAPALYLFDDNDNFSMKIITILNTSQDERYRIGLVNRFYVMKTFSWENVSERIFKAIKVLVQRYSM